MKQKADVQQGTLALMVLETLDLLGPLHGTALHGESSRSAEICSLSIKALCIQCCSSSNRKVQSNPNGARRRTTPIVNFLRAFCMRATCSVLLTTGWASSFGTVDRPIFPHFSGVPN